MTRSYAQASHKTSARPIQSPRTRLIVSLNLALMLLLLGSPLAALVLRSVQTKSGYSLLYYRELFINRHNSLFFVPPANAILNSTAIAAATTLLALVIGLAAVIVLGRDPSPSKATRHLDPLLMLPLATSAVTLGYGFIITFNKAPLNLRSSVILLPIAHALIAVPFVIRSVLPVYRAISAELHEAAALLGASPPAIWRVLDWPIIRRAVVVGAIFAFTVSMGEFGATLFVARPQTPTLPVAIFRFLGQPGDLNRGQALAMSTLLMLVVAIGFFLIERFRLGDQGEF